MYDNYATGQVEAQPQQQPYQDMDMGQPQNYFNMPQKNVSDDFLKASVYVQDLVNTIFLTLGGKERYWDDDNDKWIIKDLNNIKPLLNDLGIYRISALITSFVNHNTAHSFYSSVKVANIKINNLMKDIIRILVLRFREYAPEHRKGGLEIVDLEEIAVIMENLIEPLIFRAINGEERRSIREPKIYQQLETKNINQQERKKFMGIF